MKSAYKQKLPFSTTDEEACIENLAKHYEWVMHGDKGASKGEQTDLYALPHNAYGDRVRAKLEAEKIPNCDFGATNGDNVRTENNTPFTCRDDISDSNNDIKECSDANEENEISVEVAAMFR